MTPSDAGAQPLRAGLAALALACVALGALLGLASAVLGAPGDPSLADPLPRLQVLLLAAGLAAAVAAAVATRDPGALRARVALALAPLYALVVFAYYKARFGLQDPAYLAAVDEDNVVEWLTFAALALASVHGVRLARLAARTRHRAAAVAFALLAAFTLLVALEEISYGQRVFGFETPGELRAANTQGELNIHNVAGLEWLTDKLLPDLVMAAFLGGWALLALARRIAPRRMARLGWVDLVVPPWHVAPFMLPLALVTGLSARGFVTVCCEPGQFVIWQDQEPAELFFGLAFLIFLWDRWRVAQRRWAGTPGWGLLSGSAELVRRGLRGERSAAVPFAVALVLLALVQLPFVRAPGALLGGFDRTRLSADDLDALAARLEPAVGLAVACDGDVGTLPECRTSEAPAIALWGDTGAMRLGPALALGAGEEGVIQFARSGCMAALGVAYASPDNPPGWAEDCIAFNDAVLAWLEAHPETRLVVMSSPLGLIEWPIRTREGEVVPGPRPDLVRAALLDAVREVRAMGREVVFVSEAPTNGGRIGDCLAASLHDGAPETACDFVWNRDQFAAYGFLEELQGELPVVFLDELLCPGGTCRTRVGDTPLYASFDRLTVAGSRLLESDLGLLERIRAAAGG